MAAPATSKTVVPAGNAKAQAVVPNQTLYVTNIPSAKIAKPDLRTALYLLFSTYGAVLDVVALKTMKMRGQAHIVYRDIQTATQAMRALQGFEFLGMELKIQYAKSKSHFVSKLDGTFKLPNTSQGAAEVVVTELQASIFNAPAPGSKAVESKAAAALAPPPAAAAAAAAATPEKRSASPADGRAQKRVREEESDASDSDVAMEEDSDDE